MNLRHLEVFYAVMRAGSVTAAANMLGMSQPACSMMLKHAESSLGIKLFRRQGGRLRPTPEALVLMPEAEVIFGGVSTFNRIAKELRGGRLGRLTIASSPGLISAVLPQAVSTFAEKFEVRDIALLSLPRSEVVERAQRGEIDIGIVFDPVREPGLRVSPLTTSEVTCALPRSHPLARNTFIGAQHLTSEIVVSYSPKSLIGSVIGNHCKEAGVPPPTVSIEVNSAMTACMLASNMSGIALIEPMILTSGLFPGLIARPFRPIVQFGIQIIETEGQIRSQLATIFIAYLRQNCPTMEQVFSAEAG